VKWGSARSVSVLNRATRRPLAVSPTTSTTKWADDRSCVPHGREGTTRAKGARGLLDRRTGEDCATIVCAWVAHLLGKEVVLVHAVDGARGHAHDVLRTHARLHVAPIRAGLCVA
jgi:hypothetical protein